MIGFDRSLAVVIGINDYRNGIDPLHTAVPDAIAIAEILQKTYKYELVHPNFDSGVIVNQYATKDKLEKLLTDILLNKIKPTKSDRLILYFAGHGIARNSDEGLKGYLVPQDAHITKQDSLLKMSDVHNWLTKLECRHLLVILDCCFAGSFRWESYRKLIPVVENVTEAHYYRFIEYPAWQVLTSASHNQEALDYLNNRDIEQYRNHSPFAEGLIKALQEGEGDLNNDGVIVATELYLYLRDYVEKYSQNRQTPGLFSLKKHDRGEYLFKIPNTPLNLQPTPQLNKNNNPYRGLEAFEERHAKLFFGREELVEKLIQRLSASEHRLSIILGNSGSGKSSLAKAGLIPQLRQTKEDRWLIFKPMRPGKDPWASLAQAIEEIASNTKDKLHKNPEALVNIIAPWIEKNSSTKLLLVIDQLEELIVHAHHVNTENLSNREQPWQIFLQLLATALDKCPQFHLVITLRSDFETRFLKSALNPYWFKAEFNMRPMRSDELRKVIERPALGMALYFEPPNFIYRLIDDVAHMPGALPLLSFTLSEMYIRLYRAWYEEGKENRTLTIDAEFYQRGGVAGSLTRRANQEYINLGDEELRTTMRRVILRMLAINDWEIVRRQVPDSELVYSDYAENERVTIIIERLVNARLVVRGEGIGEPYIEPAHDYLVRGWDKLQDWIEANRKILNLQQRLTLAINDWIKNGKPKDDFLLPDGERLNQLEKIFNQEFNWFNQREIEFITASLDRRDAEYKEAREQAVRNELLKKAHQIDSLLNINNLATYKPLEGLVSAISTIGLNLQEIPNQIFTPVQNALYKAMELGRVSNVLYQHEIDINAIDWSLDGKFIASGSYDGKIILWDVENRNVKQTFECELPVFSLAFSSNGTKIVSGHDKGLICLWDIQGNLILKFQGHQGCVKSISFHPSDQLIISLDFYRRLKFCNLEGKSIEINENVSKCAGIYTSFDLTTSGEIIVLGRSDGRIQFLGLDGNLYTPFQAHSRDITSIVFSPDSQAVASSGLDGTVKIWNLRGELLTNPFPVTNTRILSLAFSPDNQTIASSGLDGTVKIWNLKDDTLLYILKHGAAIESIAFSRDNKFLVSVGRDWKVQLWNIEQEISLDRSFKAHQSGVTSIALSQDSQKIVSSSWDRTIKIWNSKTELILTIPLEQQEYINSVDVSTDGELIVGGSNLGNVYLWNVNGNLINQFGLDEIEIKSIIFVPSRNFVLIHNQNKSIWRFDTYDFSTKTLIQDSDRITSLQVSPNGRNIVTGREDGILKLWDTDGNFIHQFGNKTESSIPSSSPFVIYVPNDSLAVAFSPDGQMIASGHHDNHIRLWNIDGSSVCPPFQAHENPVKLVKFSPDGKTIVSSSWNYSYSLDTDQTLRLWDLEGNLIGHPFVGHDKVITSINFSSNGDQVISSSANGKIYFWHSNWKAWLKVCCDRLHYHSVFQNPQTEEQKLACQICQDFF